MTKTTDLLVQIVILSHGNEDFSVHMKRKGNVIKLNKYILHYFTVNHKKKKHRKERQV